MNTTERIDHAVEARDTLQEVGYPASNEGVMLHALTHATLALVEQQRIANLIALGMYTNADGSRLAQYAVSRPIGEYDVSLNDEIREGLGL